MRFVVKVSRRGQVVIPADIRRRLTLGIGWLLGLMGKL